MSKRANKYRNQFEIIKRNDIPVGFQNARILDFTHDNYIYHRKLPARYIKEVFEDNIYAKSAIDINVNSSVGRGFTENTHPDIIKFMPVKELCKGQRNYEQQFEMFLETKIRNGKALPVLYSIPSTTAQVGKKDKYADKIVLNYKTEKEQIFPKFDPDLYSLGRLKDGDYIYHVKEGDSAYGEVPGSAYKRLEIQRAFETSVNSFYKNDALPYMIITMFGIDPDSEDAQKIRYMLNNQYQGAEKNGKAAMLFSNKPRAESEPSLTTIAKQIVDANSKALDDTIKFDIAAFFGVPYWILNLVIAGKLGGSQEREMDFNCYNLFRIQPKQTNWYDEVFSILYPDYEIELARISYEDLMPTISTPAPALPQEEIVENMAKSFKKYLDSDITDLIINQTLGVENE